MKLKALCASFLVLLCTISEINCITNQEFFDLVKYFAEDLEAIDSSSSGQTIDDNDDYVIELPGNGHEDLDIPFLLTKLDLSDLFKNLESLEPVEDDEGDDNDYNGIPSKHDVEEVDGNDTTDDYDDSVAAPDNDVTEFIESRIDSQVPDDKDGDQDIENLINELDPAHSDFKPFDKPRNGRVGWFRGVIRIFRRSGRIFRRAGRTFRSIRRQGRSFRRYRRSQRWRSRRTRSRSRYRSRRSSQRSRYQRRYRRQPTPYHRTCPIRRQRYPYRSSRRRTRHRTSHRFTNAKSSSPKHCHLRLHHTFLMNLKPSSVRFRINACMNLAFLPNNDSIAFTLSNDNGQHFRKEISLTSPPALCFPVPYLKKIAHACIEAYKPGPDKKKMCLRLSANIDLKVQKYRFLVNFWCGLISNTVSEERRSEILQTIQAFIENEESGEFEDIPLYDLPQLYRDLQDEMEKRKYVSDQDEAESKADETQTLLFDPET